MISHLSSQTCEEKELINARSSNGILILYVKPVCFDVSISWLLVIIWRNRHHRDISFIIQTLKEKLQVLSDGVKKYLDLNLALKSHTFEAEHSRSFSNAS